MFGPSKRDLFRMIERERVQHRVEIGKLLDRLADQAGRPWTPSPAEMSRHQDEPAEAPTWSAAPEQDPFLSV